MAWKRGEYGQKIRNVDYQKGWHVEKVLSGPKRYHQIDKQSLKKIDLKN